MDNEPYKDYDKLEIAKLKEQIAHLEGTLRLATATNRELNEELALLESKFKERESNDICAMLKPGVYDIRVKVKSDNCDIKSIERLYELE